MVQIIVKPISTDQDEKVKPLKLDKANDKPTIIDNQKGISRIGAFEVQLVAKHEGKVNEKILHIKISSNMWPNISLILEKLHYYLPRIPSVVV